MLFMAKVAFVEGKNTQDQGKTNIIGQLPNGQNITEQFYRVVAIQSFQPIHYNSDIKSAKCMLHFVNNTEIKSTIVGVPPLILESLSCAFHQYGNPLHAKIIDLRPENQPKIIEDYKNQTGLFAYLKKDGVTIK